MTPEATSWPPKFSLDGPSIMRLLTGDRFYSSADAALREAILNAIDACGRRAAADSEYSRSITVTFDEATRTLTIADNGDGMDRNDVSSLFAKIGASASRAIEKTSEGKYQAVGEFGIGVVSYFLVCETFEVHTKSAASDPIGLVFSNTMFDMQRPAEEISPNQASQGTTVILRIVDQPRFNLLLSKFEHWVRDVPYLTATSSAKGQMAQGGRRSHVSPVVVSAPDWVEKAELGPPVELDYWKVLDGRAHVDVLYRGVFVQQLDLPQLWGIEGSLHVNPKQFKPKLNRESFIAEGFDAEIQEFLRQVHPKILEAALANARRALAAGEQDGWGIGRWIAIWLAIPRGGAYADVALKWDDEFRGIKAFRQLTESAESRVSLKDIEASGANPIYIVPNPIDSAPAEVRKAVSVLRARGAYLIQGLQRDTGYLSLTSFTAGNTSELLLSHFRSKLPQLIGVEEVARNLIRSEQTLGEVFPVGPKVLLVRLGTNAAAVARIDGALWLNVETDPGRAIVREICRRNDGFLGLLAAVQQFARQHSIEVVQHLDSVSDLNIRLGPVRRQFLLGLIK